MPGGIWVTPSRNPVRRPSVSVFSTHGVLLIQPLATLTIGFQTPGPTVEKLADTVSDEILGTAIRQALADSAELPLAHEVNKSAPEIRASGLRTQREFMDGARHVSVDVRDGVPVAVPSRNESPRRPRAGFSYIEPWHSTSAPSDELLGATVRRALADCTFATPVKRRASRADDIGEH